MKVVCSTKILDIATKPTKFEDKRKSDNSDFTRKKLFAYLRKKTRTGRDSNLSPRGAKASSLALSQVERNLEVESFNTKASKKAWKTTNKSCLSEKVKFPFIRNFLYVYKYTLKNLGDLNISNLRNFCVRDL